MKRRDFIKNSTLGTITTFMGIELVFGKVIPNGYTPLALQDSDPFKLFSKDRGMTVLNDKPWNIEAAAHLLDDKITPN
ncbi:MAG: molybdopterin containing oxidoreductase, partial [Maribacter sp.]